MNETASIIEQESDIFPEWELDAIEKLIAHMSNTDPYTHEQVVRLLASYRALQTENERLYTWDAIMELLQRHYPEDIFPVLPDDPKRDLGPRIISLIRLLAEREKRIATLETEEA